MSTEGRNGSKPREAESVSPSALRKRAKVSARLFADRESRSPPNYFRPEIHDLGPFSFGVTIESVELHVEDLRLRPPSDDDVEAVTEACQDGDLSRFIPFFPNPYREQDARAWIGSRKQDETARTFLIVDGAGTLLGAIEVRLGDTGSIGYWVAKEARGRGVATRATKLLAEWVIREAGVQRLELTTDPKNLASQRVAEKAGFTREGTLRAHTSFPEGRRDSVMFSLVPADLA